MANSVSAYLWKDKDYQEEIVWKVLGFFFFPLSHHLQHGQITLGKLFVLLLKH